LLKKTKIKYAFQSLLAVIRKKTPSQNKIRVSPCL